MALWDIKGKAFSLTLYRLLGGKFRSELRCYASQLQSGWKAVREKCQEPQEYAEAALAAKEQGYDAVKNAKKLIFVLVPILVIILMLKTGNLATALLMGDLLVFAAVSGWGRTYETDEQLALEGIYIDPKISIPIPEGAKISTYKFKGAP